MNNQNTTDNARSEKWPSWLVLFLRWVLGGLFGIVISSWMYFGLKNDVFTGLFLRVLEMLSILLIPFEGQLYLFRINTASFLHVSDFFITFPVLIWGLIGTLLASGRRDQIVTGVVLLILYVIVGYISFILIVLTNVPT